MTDHCSLVQAQPPQVSGLAGIRAAASMTPSSYSPADNSIGVVWNTGAVMAQYGYYPDGNGGFIRGAYDVQLAMEPESFDLSALNNHAPFLDNHAYDDMGMVNMTNRAVVGKVIPGTAQIIGGQGVARVTLSTAPGDADLVTKLITGIIANVSVGVKLLRTTRIDAPEDGRARPLFRADLSQPYEISAVPLGADRGAHTFSKAQEPVPMTTVHAPAVDETEIRRAERERCDAIRHRFGLLAKRTDDTAEKATNDRLLASLLDSGASVAEANNKVLDRMAEMDAKFSVQPAQATQLRSGRVEIGRTEFAARGAAAEACLMARAGLRAEVPDSENGYARFYRGKSLGRIAEDTLRLCGHDVDGLSENDVADFAIRRLGRSDEAYLEFMRVRASGGAVSIDNLPYLLANTANKSLRLGQAQAPITFKTWCKQGEPLKDYKTASHVLLSDMADLEELPEGATPRAGDMTESNVNIRLKDYAKRIPITRIAIVNDDLSGFTRVPMEFGKSADRKQNTLAYAKLIESGNYTSANTGTAGAPSSTTLSELRAKMRRRVALGATGNTDRSLNYSPKILIVPPEHETAALALKATLNPQTTTDAKDQQFADLVVVTDAALSNANKWYVAADPNEYEGVLYNYLAGENGVVLDTFYSQENGNLIVQARLAFTVNVIDSKALGYNAGV